MIKDKLNYFINKLKEKDGEYNKRKIENLVISAVILIITIILLNAILNNNNSNKNKTESESEKILAKVETKENISNTNNTKDDLEEKLRSILSKIEGVGKVDVLITYSESSKITAMYNEDSTQNDTQESDTQGGNRKISQTSTKKEVIYKESNGEKVPVTQSVINPKIEGAIVTASRCK